MDGLSRGDEFYLRVSRLETVSLSGAYRELKDAAPLSSGRNHLIGYFYRLLCRVSD